MSFYEVTTPTDSFLLTGSEPVPISFLLPSQPPFLPSSSGIGLVSYRSHPASRAVLFLAKIRALHRYLSLFRKSIPVSDGFSGRGTRHPRVLPAGTLR